MADKRLAALPNVPTLAEAGVPDQEADTLTGIVAPAGTPQPIVDQLQKEIAKIVAAPDVKEKLVSIGFIPIANTPQQFGVRIKTEMDKWAKVVRAANLKIE
jgi:tripartite-type tricarboxylate transporter receptor subunit TctC